MVSFVAGALYWLRITYHAGGEGRLEITVRCVAQLYCLAWGGTLVVHVDTSNILPAIGCQLLIPFIFWGSIQPFPGERPALAGKIVTGMHKQLGRREKAGGRGREGKK